MRAVSFVGETRHIVDRAESVKSSRPLDGSLSIWSDTWSASDALSDLLERLAAGLPLPTLTEPPDSRSEAAIETILDGLYEERRVDPSHSGVTDATNAGRVRVVGEFVVVPLSRLEPEAANWYSLLRWLTGRFESVQEWVNRAIERLKLIQMTTAADVWRGIAQEIDNLRRVLGRILAVTRWLSPANAVDAEVRETQQVASSLLSLIGDRS